MENKIKSFNLRLKKEIREKLDYLARIRKRSRANVISLMIEDEYAGAKIIEKGEYLKEQNPARLIRRIVCDVKDRRMRGNEKEIVKRKYPSYNDFLDLKKQINNAFQRVTQIEEREKLKDGK